MRGTRQKQYTIYMYRHMHTYTHKAHHKTISGTSWHMSEAIYTIYMYIHTHIKPITKQSQARPGTCQKRFDRLLTSLEAVHGAHGAEASRWGALLVDCETYFCCCRRANRSHRVPWWTAVPCCVCACMYDYTCGACTFVVAI